MPLKQREAIVQQSHNCFLCLKTGHSVRDCNVRASCLCCGKKHHILLCRKMNPISESKDKESLEVDKRTDSSSEMDQALSNLSTNPNVILQTFKVVIRGNGKKRAARAIIDTGSQRSYLLRATAEEMSYEPTSCEYLQRSLFGDKHTG
ncbi:uncharacterized protein LOC129969324 [Argiope bruennichi]|uniref:uncharacterized protein LOC129969324 n=1 Tax=Argiope bruennichi TaxID=94029 RepID=UPI0024956EB9|nr:uncharacterized protein LOC129969324 [Argiope bruennichi]